jgi:hypothetical protein
MAGSSAGDAPDTLRIRDFGDEVHLWIEQRVPWPVALEIVRVLTARAPQPEAASHRRHRRPGVLRSTGKPVRSRKARSAA